MLTDELEDKLDWALSVASGVLEGNDVVDIVILGELLIDALAVLLTKPDVVTVDEVDAVAVDDALVDADELLVDDCITLDDCKDVLETEIVAVPLFEILEVLDDESETLELPELVTEVDEVEVIDIEVEPVLDLVSDKDLEDVLVTLLDLLPDTEADNVVLPDEVLVVETDLLVVELALVVLDTVTVSEIVELEDEVELPDTELDVEGEVELVMLELTLAETVLVVDSDAETETDFVWDEVADVVLLFMI